MREQEQQMQLARMRRLATSLLVLMAVVFVGAKLLQPQYEYMSFIAAFAEAAMVGALADWFAVTALFRRPLGLPIPHTAIIPNNKDRIGESVGNFLEHNFMTPEVLADELQQVDFAGGIAAWLTIPENSRAVAGQIVRGIPALFRMIDDKEVSNFIQLAVSAALKNMKFAPLAAEILSVLMADKRHQVLFDHFLRLASRTLEQNKPFIRQKIHDRSPRWIPKVVDEKFFENLLEELRNILNEMKDENSEWRSRFELSAQELVEKLRTSPDYEEKISLAIDQMLSHPLFQDYTDHVLRDLRHRLTADADSGDSQLVAQLDLAIRAFSDALGQDIVVQDKFNRWLREFATEAISSRREGIADLFKRVIRKWDADTVSRKFELYVGKDLQYIRINGTLVGGLVGLILHGVSLVL